MLSQLQETHKPMKIGIVTMPPAMGQNYGCILQAYALQKILSNNGFDSQILDIRNSPQPRSFIRKAASFLYRFFRHYVLRDKEYPLPWHQWDFSEKERNIIYDKTLNFVNKHLHLTEQLIPRKLYNIVFDYDVFLAGSDQIWRPKYVSYQPHFFLDFVKDKKDIKRIAYAASFGVDTNEFTEELLKICKPLAQTFDAVSVRENSGIKLCKDLLGIESIQVLDPTLLLDVEHYTKISYERNDFQNDGNLFAYVLDESEEKQIIIDLVSQKMSLKSFKIQPKAKYPKVGPKHINDCILPSVEQWLRGFVDAKYVVTDSFHGCVFSILYKKPFIAIGNSNRGMARFYSLLKLFELEDRLVFCANDVSSKLITKTIDYDKVYRILESERHKSKEFLFNAIRR